MNSVKTLKKGGFTRSKKGSVGMESMAKVVWKKREKVDSVKKEKLLKKGK